MEVNVSFLFLTAAQHQAAVHPQQPHLEKGPLFLDINTLGVGGEPIFVHSPTEFFFF